MQAILLKDGDLTYVTDHPVPKPRSGWALIRVLLAGICKTDLELQKGYRGFKGVPGHEFIGRVEQCDDPRWVAKRVVGEINAACGQCAWCAQDLGRHCPHRTTLGIHGLDGCMAEFCTLPTANLYEVPPGIADTKAVLTELLAAACEIHEQVRPMGSERVLVLGDGRLGILCAWSLATRCRQVTLVGRHPEKLARASWRDIRTCLEGEALEREADLVVEATGSPEALSQALRLCRPRGTIVLKSTMAQAGTLDLSPLVVNEQTLIGSRCGRFNDALSMMRRFPDLPLERLVTDRFPLPQAREAFKRASEGAALKVVLEVAA